MLLPEEQLVLAEAQRLGPLEAYRSLIAANDALIRGPDLSNGRAITTARTAIYTSLVRGWAEEQQSLLGYGKPFAVVALGGTGRGEMTPCSDNDFAFLFDDALEGNRFLLELQRQLLHTREFEERHGFACLALPFSLDDVPNLEGKQLNSFLDMRPVFDPHGLVETFRARIRATYDPFEHFLHVRGFWKDRWESAARECERLDRFDIKNDGLRVFLAGIWTLAGKRFTSSHEVYQTLDDPRALEAYEFLLRIRSFIHLRRQGSRRPLPDGSHPEDVLGFAEFTAFGELLVPDAAEREGFEFANEVRARLLAARRRVALFAKGVIEGELAVGREVSPGSFITLGVTGLRQAAPNTDASAGERSQAALNLLLAAQRYEVPIAPTELQATFLNAGDWLLRRPELAQLFYEGRGSLADTFAFLSQLVGAEERWFPGHAKFESSLDERVLTERTTLRGAFERRKLRALEGLIAEGRTRLPDAITGSNPATGTPGADAVVAAALLDGDQLAAVRLALKTKRLPLTPEDEAARRDEARPLHERFASGFSGIPLADYYEPFYTEAGFPEEALRLTRFLVLNRRAFKERAATGLNDARQVVEFAQLCGSEAWLRALFVFTCADRVEWESEQTEPARWFNSRELYLKTLLQFRPAADAASALRASGYSPEQLAILHDFGEDFFGGVYRRFANRFGAHLVRLVEEPDAPPAKATLLREGTATILGVAARDYRGLAATISGELWRQAIDLRQAHLFSAMHHGLALDFFHLAPRVEPLPGNLARRMEEAIRQQLHIATADEASLPRITGAVSLHEWRPGQLSLRCETTSDVTGAIYVLTYQIFQRLRGNVFGLAAHAARGTSFVSVYFTPPPETTLDAAKTALGSFI